MNLRQFRKLIKSDSQWKEVLITKKPKRCNRNTALFIKQRNEIISKMLDNQLRYLTKL